MYNRYPHVTTPIYPTSKEQTRAELETLTQDYCKKNGLVHWLKVIPIEQIQAVRVSVPEFFTVLGKKREMNEERQRIVNALIHRVKAMSDEFKPDSSLIITQSQVEALKRLEALKKPSTIDARLQKLNGKRSYSSSRFSLPENQSVMNSIKEAMEAFPNDMESAAKVLSMSRSNFSFIRKLMILQEDQWVPREAKMSIQKCLASIEKEHRIERTVTKVGGDVIKRYWVVKKDRPARIAMRLKRFDQNMVAIRESCECTLDMVIPRELNQDEIADTISSLTISVEQINKLIRRLLGGKEEADG